MHDAQFDRAGSAGLFVGVRDFEDTVVPTVIYAVDDAINLAFLFSVELGLLEPQNITLALAGTPEKPQSAQQLQQLVEAGAVIVKPTLRLIYQNVYELGQKTASNGIFITTIASHGLIDQGTEIIALTDVYRRRPVHTGLVLNVLLDDISTSIAQRRLVFIDSCRSPRDPHKRGVDDELISQSFRQAIAQNRGLAVLAAATRGGPAYQDKKRKNGVFSAAILDGLRGAAASDERAFITLGTLSEYTDNVVRTWVRKNRSENLEKSLGIQINFDPPRMRTLPLTTDASARREIREFQQRVKIALSNLFRNSDTSADDTFDGIPKFFRFNSKPRPLHLQLLELVENFDNSETAKFTIRGFLNYHGAALANLLKLANEPAENTGAWVNPGWSILGGQDPFGTWAEFRINGHSQVMRLIPAGSFLMGGTGSEPQSRPWEIPQHKVTLSEPFWLADTACTQQLWQAVMHGNPSRYVGMKRPVERVSWLDVQEFLYRLKEHLPEVRLELPTEAQWEFACRAGSTTTIYSLKDGQLPKLEEIAWHELNSQRSGTTDHPEKEGTHEVGLKTPNSWGLRDMLGNVFEWCRDCGERGTPYPPDAIIDPWVSEGADRVIRGGAWISHASEIRCSSRDWQSPDRRTSYLGFRILIEATVP